MQRLYYKYSDFLKKKYNKKVYKLPINLQVSCPNRDGNISLGGCIFCGEKGAGHENLDNHLSVKEQLIRNKEYIKKKYKATAFIAYLQNFTNTYLPLTDFKKIINNCIMEDIVEIAISTRPDCIKEEYLKFLDNFSNEYKINITFELGLQTVNYHTLDRINRGHGLAEYIDAVLRIKKYGFDICTHLILNLPWDDDRDIIECSKIVSALGINQIKLHSLYIVKNTKLADLYLNKEFKMISMEHYIKRVITFLEYLDPNIVVQRLIARVPKEESIFANWDTSWWKILSIIENEMQVNNTYQGKKFNYVNGAALNFLK